MRTLLFAACGAAILTAMFCSVIAVWYLLVDDAGWGKFGVMIMLIYGVPIAAAIGGFLGMLVGLYTGPPRAESRSRRRGAA